MARMQRKSIAQVTAYRSTMAAERHAVEAQLTMALEKAWRYKISRKRILELVEDVQFREQGDTYGA